jgi:hypothetical protein
VNAAKVIVHVVSGAYGARSRSATGLSPIGLIVHNMPNGCPPQTMSHAHMMAIYFMHYNFVRIYQTLKVTPAMAAGVTPNLWEISGMMAVLEQWEAMDKLQS